jgi:hypothetical protein
MPQTARVHANLSIFNEPRQRVDVAIERLIGYQYLYGRERQTITARALPP